MKENCYHRTQILIGKENVEKLKKQHVVICGIGGVGSYALEALARIGIGEITIVDKDVVDVTNINRQIIALNGTIGKYKVNVAKDRVHEINEEILVHTMNMEINKENVEQLFQEKIDYVVDCVDNIEAKIAIIQNCYHRNIKCISCMGTANKLNPLDLKVEDIYKTTMCPLAKLMRKNLKQIGIKKQKVVYSTEIPKKRTKEEKEVYGNTLGSVSFVPSCAGLIIASEVVKDLLELS